VNDNMVQKADECLEPPILTKLYSGECSPAMDILGYVVQFVEDSSGDKNDHVVDGPKTYSAQPKVYSRFNLRRL
jgi:hypothetical protein